MDLNYVPLKQTECLNIINNSNIAILSVAKDNQPYSIPMYYDIDTYFGKIIFTMKSLTSSCHIKCLQDNDLICLLITSKCFNYIDSIIIKGTASLNKCSQSFEITIIPDCITGRRYFLA